MERGGRGENSSPNYNNPLFPFLLLFSFVIERATLPGKGGGQTSSSSPKKAPSPFGAGGTQPRRLLCSRRGRNTEGGKGGGRAPFPAPPSQLLSVFIALGGEGGERERERERGGGSVKKGRGESSGSNCQSGPGDVFTRLIMKFRQSLALDVVQFIF